MNWRAVLAVLGLALALLPSSGVVHEHEPGGQIVLGVDPDLYVETLIAANTWTTTGYVAFTVVAGCGNGDVNVCLATWDSGHHVAWWDASTATIYVDGHDLALWTPAMACHELGHVLGLSYHRTDYLSCMSAPDPTIAYPDAIDLEHLGFVSPYVYIPAEPTPAPLHDGTGGPLMGVWADA